MQVKTAAAACAVQRFAHKVKARTALELEVLIHLPQGQPAAGGLGLLPAAGGQPFKAPVLGGVGQLLPLCGGEHGRRVAVLQPGGRPHSTAQLLVQQAQPEVSGAAPCRLGGVGRKQAGKCGFVGGLCGTAFGYYSALHSRRRPAKAVKFSSTNSRRKR